MPRARQLKPGFFKNELLAKCSPWARLLFEGLWCLADRAGRLEDRPDRLKGEIFPYDRVKTDQLLGELESKVEADGSPAFLVRYEVRGRRYIQIVNFLKHQNPHKKEVKSTIPAPGQHRASTGPAPGRHRAGTVLAPGQHRASRASFLTPSSLTPSSKLPLPPTASQSTPPPSTGEGSATTTSRKAKTPSDDETSSVCPWHPEDEERFGQWDGAHPRWSDYIEQHMVARTPAPWPRFLEWLESADGDHNPAPTSDAGGREACDAAG